MLFNPFVDLAQAPQSWCLVDGSKSANMKKCRRTETCVCIDVFTGSETCLCIDVFTGSETCVCIDVFTGSIGCV